MTGTGEDADRHDTDRHDTDRHRGPAQDPLAEELDDMVERDLRRKGGIHPAGVPGSQGLEEPAEPRRPGTPKG